MADTKGDCFIIMPITTPDNLVDLYDEDESHFEKVLKHLFIPAVKAAGFTPIPPIAKGADIIHAEIIKKLEEADLVLCDMSIFNPNVFYELGIRTARDKPVCLVKDDTTEKIPFDTAIINCHEYKAVLKFVEIEEEIKLLKEHIYECVDGSDGTNTMWRCFGITAGVSNPLGGDVGVKEYFDIITKKLDRLLENEAILLSLSEETDFMDFARKIVNERDKEIINKIVKRLRTKPPSGVAKPKKMALREAHQIIKKHNKPVEPTA